MGDEELGRVREMRRIVLDRSFGHSAMVKAEELDTLRTEIWESGRSACSPSVLVLRYEIQDEGR